MKTFKKQFIDFLLEKGALKFGEFKLKSGRMSPYFINTGMFDDGASIERLGYFYASLINDVLGDEFDVIFSPAYKGIPLAVATVISLSKDYETNKGYLFDRKEAKTHGEATQEEKIKSALVGRKIGQGARIVLIDDVFTTGDTKYAAIELLNGLASGLKFPALVIAVDRQEVGLDGKSAIEEFEQKTKIPVFLIVSVSEIVAYLSEKGQMTLDEKQKILDYLKQYGVEKVKKAMKL
ncbi:MAG: orotate phosphoribosyltransferase [Candidatus Nealsonbacteria bacterium CG08_land_8_20_14_0_20_38_20]|uniref:Orotate phosphoribosyltransferase n=1 Tax=Candidatus Nealsonbacteria bacterium CG08_land_8_20_14_0_20_38_20 TaxID=1974705 RepID=A0A2H0YMU2_9BACT|nr:MAG: orotate phosphoribosyltransferase [Candidatus Nealsonbacteria bacterium CG08_land_8_20_14_0_20_38_20]